MMKIHISTFKKRTLLESRLAEFGHVLLNNTTSICSSIARLGG